MKKPTDRIQVYWERNMQRKSIKAAGSKAKGRGEMA